MYRPSAGRLPASSVRRGARALHKGANGVLVEILYKTLLCVGLLEFLGPQIQAHHPVEVLTCARAHQMCLTECGQLGTVELEPGHDQIAIEMIAAIA